MKFIQKEFSHTHEEKKSKFIAYLLPFSLFAEKLSQIKEEHPKARHYVYAYRYLNEYDQIIENSSDDGEPRGTSGKPCLHVIAGNDLINTAVIVVRYFGGIKLGTGGLVRAYSQAVNAVIDISQSFPYQKLEQRKMILPYNKLSQIEYLATNHHIALTQKHFDKEVTIICHATKEDFLAFETELPLGIVIKMA